MSSTTVIENIVDCPLGSVHLASNMHLKSTITRPRKRLDFGRVQVMASSSQYSCNKSTKNCSRRKIKKLGPKFTFAKPSVLRNIGEKDHSPLPSGVDWISSEKVQEGKFPVRMQPEENKLLGKKEIERMRFYEFETRSGGEEDEEISEGERSPEVIYLPKPTFTDYYNFYCGKK